MRVRAGAEPQRAQAGAAKLGHTRHISVPEYNPDMDKRMLALLALAAAAAGHLPAAAGQVSPVVGEPVPVSAVFNHSAGFGALAGAHDVEVFGIDGRTYALVAGADGGGLQIINVTDPAHPAPVAAVFSDSAELGIAGGAHAVEIFGIDGRTYALVAAADDNMVQIINVTDPAHPAQVFAASDGSGGFSALGGAIDAEVFGASNRTYMAVAAVNDGGVQIMDVTDPAHAMPAFAALDGSGDFSALGGAIDAEVFVVGSRTYVAVAAMNDGGLQIMDVTDPVRTAPVAAVFEGYGGTPLKLVNGVDAYQTGSGTYVVAVSDDGWAQIIDVTDPAHPAPVAAVLGDSGGFGAPHGTDVEAYQVWGRTYAVAASRDADGIYVVDVTDPARPAPVAAVFDDSGGFDALRGAHDAEVFGVDGRTYAVVAAMDDNGVQVMDVTPPLPHYLNASVKVTGYERLPHGDNDFVQVTAEITNRGHAALSGELRVSLNALANWRAVQSCDMAQNHCTRPNGDYIAYHDADRGQAEAYGVTVSDDDCTARDGWGAGYGEAAEVSFCYWVGAEFEPESAQFHHIAEDRVVSVPFTGHGSCYLPYMLCDESALTPVRDARVQPTPPVDPFVMYEVAHARLVLVFQESVVASEPDNISLVFDTATYGKNGTLTTLAGAEVDAVGGQFGNHVLAFVVDELTHADVLDAVTAGGGLRVAIGAGAVYAEDGFVDVAAYGGRVAPLVADVLMLP